MLYDNKVISSESHTIADFVRNRVFRGDNQSVGVRHVMICKIMADNPDQLLFAVILWGCRLNSVCVFCWHYFQLC